MSYIIQSKNFDLIYDDPLPHIHGDLTQISMAVLRNAMYAISISDASFL